MSSFNSTLSKQPIRKYPRGVCCSRSVRASFNKTLPTSTLPAHTHKHTHALRQLSAKHWNYCGSTRLHTLICKDVFPRWPFGWQSGQHCGSGRGHCRWGKGGDLIVMVGEKGGERAAYSVELGFLSYCETSMPKFPCTSKRLWFVNKYVKTPTP